MQAVGRAHYAEVWPKPGSKQGFGVVKCQSRKLGVDTLGFRLGYSYKLYIGQLLHDTQVAGTNMTQAYDGHADG